MEGLSTVAQSFPSELLVMDKVADAIMESMGKEWQAMIQKSTAKRELHEKLAKIFHEGMQKQK
jgi:O-methyltransferase involved in polyketide biosynthesis